MEFSNCSDILQFLKNNYYKLLIVNLEQDTYCPKVIADDEVKALGDKLDYVFSHYTAWFCDSEFIHPDDKVFLKEFFSKAKAGSSTTYRRKLNGDFHRVLLLLQPTVTKGEVLLYVRDIDEIYAKERELVISTDEMTGLLNRHAYYRDIRAYDGSNVGVIFADLNGLKYTNDHKGHKAGDELIIRFGNMLKLQFGDYKCYHISGDEFVVLAPNVSLQKFLSRAMAFHKTIWSAMDTPIASMGYSIAEQGIDVLEATIDVAEKSMYNDKLMFYQRFPELKR